MKIVSVEVIPFRLERMSYGNGQLRQQKDVRQTVTKIVTDAGAEGYYLGGHGHGDQDGLLPWEAATIEGIGKSMLVGQDPFDREKFWQWLWVSNQQESLISVIDLALWDLQARAFGVPVHKLLGGCREKVKAYASTFPNMGSVENYAQHALECKRRGYRHYKIHPYYFWDPETQKPVPGRPSHVDWDIAVCHAVREAVGDDMVLSFDPWGTYVNYEEAYKVGCVLEDLGFYWYEHPMPEYRVESYVKLARELEIPILSPEIAAGGFFTRADWIARGASDMIRIDVLRGGITGCKKATAVAEAYGVKCEMHMAGFGNLQILGATSEDTCEWYERGLEAPGLVYDTVPPYLYELCDPLDADGTVRVPQEPGLGFKINWDYIRDNRIA
jgi:L-alanine-DL-glutamate epimerase-like enolase superfamily enzyme